MRNCSNTNINAADLSQDQNGIAIDASSLFAASAHAIVTGSSPAGTLKLQASNDTPPILGGTKIPVNWVDIPNATVSVSGVGDYLIPKTDLAYMFIRAVWAKSAGTGAITVNIKESGF